VPDSTPILKISDLDIGFTTYGRRIQVLHDVSLSVGQGERVALIGQSGSGKTVTMRAVIGTLPMPPADISRGSIKYMGKELLTLAKRERNRLKGAGISIVLQDPLLSFNPVLTIERQMEDVVRFADLRLGRSSTRKNRRQLILDTLEKVQLKEGERVLKAYPMMLSGGMRQRVLIALALLNNPRLLIADEPGTALDVTTQQEILNLLNRLVADEGLSLLLITHNLGVVREMADRVYVMRRGQIVEHGSREALFSQAEHAYTRKLMNSVPALYGDKVRGIINSGSDTCVYQLDAVCKDFIIRKGVFNRKASTNRAVDRVDLSVNQGDVFGIAGESGSGKTTLARLLLGFYEPSNGRVIFDGKPLSSALGTPSFRKRVQIVYQNPGSSLNPRRSVAQALQVPLKFAGMSGAQMDERVSELLAMVDLPESYRSKYPHELSGGQKQRVAIARALSVSPEIVVLDEPTSALDVMVQNTIIELLLQLRAELNLTYIFISHDLSLMRNFCNRVAIMFRGQVCEQGDVDQIFEHPSHPYTRALLSAIPVISEFEESRKPLVSAAERLEVLAGSTVL
jgi:peptide/nickel transport system ATP-binding protein